MKLTAEEHNLLEGKGGPTLQKVMRTLVLYGKSLGAHRFIEIGGGGHFSGSLALPGAGPRLEMLDELAQAGLKTKHPFTLNPRPPLDFENLDLTSEQEQVFEQRLCKQPRYEEEMLRLGLRDKEAYTCTPYLPEVGNIPKRGAILAWSESSCVVFANSVLGARTNRNAGIMDILSNIAGKTPLTGLLTDEGRRATWLIEVRTSKLPNPQLLGAAIGMKVLEDVPYIVGLDDFLGSGADGKTIDYLKEMGAACAAIGAVGLYHVEDITPEAVDQKTTLLAPSHRTYIIDERELEDLMASYPIMWADKEDNPRKCLIGCPHLSLRQLYWWGNKILEVLEAKCRRQIGVETILCAAPQVLSRFKEDKGVYQRLIGAGVKLSASCLEAYMTNRLCAREPVITNSNKLRAFSTARMLLDEDLLQAMATGDVKGEN